MIEIMKEVQSITILDQLKTTFTETRLGSKGAFE